MKSQGSDCIGLAKPHRRRGTFMLLLSVCTILTSGLLYVLLSTSPFDSPIFHAEPFTPAHEGPSQSDEAVTGTHDEAANTGSNTIELHPEDHVFREPTTIQITLNVTKQERAPDGAVRPIYLINDQFPGPLIEARSGDELVIDVVNSISSDDKQGGNDGESISMHWHGLSMIDANDMDGVVGLTQCGIAPARNFRYRFKIEDDQHGTFWYHSHSGVQRADGLFGPFVIHKPAADAGAESDMDTYGYEKEQLLLVNDWYHRTAVDVLDWFTDSLHYGLEPAADSILINGQGSYNCSMAVPAWPINCTAVPSPKIRLIDGQRVRLRIVNTGVSSGFALSVSQATMKPITVDGGNKVSPETPPARTIGVLYPGERIDVIVNRERDDDQTSPQLTVTLDLENAGFYNFALEPEQSFPLEWAADNSHDDVVHDIQAEVLPQFNLHDLKGEVSSVDPQLVKEPKETAVLYSEMQLRAASRNHPVGAINHTSWMVTNPQALPLLAMEREDWTAAAEQPTSAQKLIVPWFRESGEDEWITLVINNFDDKGHPFHLHGYSFYVLATQQYVRGAASGFNPFDPAATAAQSFNTENPLRKDTAYVPSMGYVVLRFPLNNDGLWLLHCHVMWHQAIGMGIVLQVGKDVPRDAKARVAAQCT